MWLCTLPDSARGPGFPSLTENSVNNFSTLRHADPWLECALTCVRFTQAFSHAAWWLRAKPGVSLFA